MGNSVWRRNLPANFDVTNPLVKLLTNNNKIPIPLLHVIVTNVPLYLLLVVTTCMGGGPDNRLALNLVWLLSRSRSTCSDILC